MGTPTGSVQMKERQWSRHIERWERSGLSQRHYCEQNGLSVSTFQLRRRHLTTPSTPIAEPFLDLVPVPRPASPIALVQPITVVVGGGRFRVEVSGAFHVGLLSTLLDVLESRG